MEFSVGGGSGGYGLDTRNREGGLKTSRRGRRGVHALVSWFPSRTFCDPHHSYLSSMPIASTQWFVIWLE